MKIRAYCPKYREFEERRSAIRVVGSEASNPMQGIRLDLLSFTTIQRTLSLGWSIFKWRGHSEPAAARSQSSVSANDLTTLPHFSNSLFKN